MAVTKPTESKEVQPKQVETKLVDPNTGLEVAPVKDDFDTYVKTLGLGGPCKNC
jgi:hypothetical protein